MRREQRLIRIVAALVAAVLVLSGTTSWLYIQQRGQTETAVTGERQAEEEARSIAQPAQRNADQVLALCRSLDAEQLAELEITCAPAEQTKEAIDGTDTPNPPRDGTDGRSATIGQVLTATARLLPDTLAEYCAERNECTPPEPEPAEDGTDGADATQAQVDDAVARFGPSLLARFCSTRNDCTPPAPADGKDGAGGPAGDDAPVITAIVCDGTTGRFTFDDGSTIDVPDMCAAPLVPPPEPAG